MTFAWLAAAPLDDTAALAHLGPGLAPAADAPPIPALAWNHFAFALGRRLLVAMNTGDAEPHVLEVCVHALAMIAGAESLLGQPDALLQVGTLSATLHPMTMLSPSPAAPLLLRLFDWGTRRLQRDRKLADSLATLCAEARALHGLLAARAGADPDAASSAELAAQRSDARTVLAGASASLVGAEPW